MVVSDMDHGYARLRQYLTPTDGRPYPHDSHANDLIYWQTEFAARHIDELTSDLRAARTVLVSPAVVPLTRAAQHPLRALHVRDPDGHALRLIEQ